MPCPIELLKCHTCKNIGFKRIILKKYECEVKDLGNIVFENVPVLECKICGEYLFNNASDDVISKKIDEIKKSMEDDKTT